MLQVGVRSVGTLDVQARLSGAGTLAIAGNGVVQIDGGSLGGFAASQFAVTRQNGVGVVTVQG